MLSPPSARPGRDPALRGLNRSPQPRAGSGTPGRTSQIHRDRPDRGALYDPAVFMILRSFRCALTAPIALAARYGSLWHPDQVSVYAAAIKGSHA